MFKWLLGERDPVGDEIVDLSAGPYRSKMNYTLLGRIVAIRRVMDWLDKKVEA